MKAVLDSMHDGVLVVDQTDKIVYANAAAHKLLGLPPDEHATHRPPFAIPAHGGCELVLPAGVAVEVRTSPMVWHGVPTRLLVLRDITALRRSQHQVRSLGAQLDDLLEREREARRDADRQRALLQEALDAVPAIICVYHGPAHRYQYVNARFCDGMGQRADAVIGRGPRDVLGDELGTMAEGILDGVYRSREIYCQVDMRFPGPPAPDGTPTDVYLTVTYIPLLDAAGEVSNVLVHALDVTESMQARLALEQKGEEVARLNRELERRVAERTTQLEATNAELEAFTYSVSHDLRGPLRRIDGYGEALREDCRGSLSAEGLHYLDRIQASTRHMGQLIDDLLSLSRISRSEMHLTTVDLSALARDIVAVLAEQTPDRQVAVTVAPDLHAWGHREFLRIALENLLNNAWKFTGRTDAAEIVFDVMDEGGTRVFYVQDNGAGFDPRFSDMLFGIFDRLHSPSEFPGTGIGLATVKRVLERHGGRIWAEGAVDRGAVFYFTLPERPGDRPADD